MSDALKGVDLENLDDVVMQTPTYSEPSAEPVEDQSDVDAVEDAGQEAPKTPDLDDIITPDEWLQTWAFIHGGAGDYLGGVYGAECDLKAVALTPPGRQTGLAVYRQLCEFPFIRKNFLGRDSLMRKDYMAVAMYGYMAFQTIKGAAARGAKAAEAAQDAPEVPEATFKHREPA